MKQKKEREKEISQWPWISMLPFGILAGYWGNKEVRITAISEYGFQTRLAAPATVEQKNAPWELAFYDQKTAAYQRILLRDATFLQEKEEDFEIEDFDLPFSLSPDMPLWEINANCRMVLEIEGTPVGNEMKAIQQKWFASFDEFIDHKDEIRFYDVGDGAALAEYLIREENIFGEIPHELQKHIDYHSYGNELEMDDRYLFTTSGVFRYQ